MTTFTPIPGGHAITSPKTGRYWITQRKDNVTAVYPVTGFPGPSRSEFRGFVLAILTRAHELKKQRNEKV